MSSWQTGGVQKYTRRAWYECTKNSALSRSQRHTANIWKLIRKLDVATFSSLRYPAASGKLLIYYLPCRCDQCGRSSALPSRFYELELNIQGHKNLTECITEFLKVSLECLPLFPPHTQWLITLPQLSNQTGLDSEIQSAKKLMYLL